MVLHSFSVVSILDFWCVSFHFSNFRSLKLSVFVVLVFVVRFSEIVFLVLRCPMSDFTVSDFAVFELHVCRFSTSDCLRFDVRVAVFRFSNYKFQDSMSNRWHFQVLLFDLLTSRVNHFSFYVWFTSFQFPNTGVRLPTCKKSLWVSSWVISGLDKENYPKQHSQGSLLNHFKRTCTRLAPRPV